MFEIDGPYKYWGYGDMDIIWGNITRYAHLFQGNYEFIITGYFGTNGAAAWYVNEAWTRELFLSDPLYVVLLKNSSYHNLDEGGNQVNKKNVFDGGRHSISQLQKNFLDAHKARMNRNKHWMDFPWLDQEACRVYAGPVSWMQGSLKTMHGSQWFPPGRELLFFHRPESRFQLPRKHKEAILNDMKENGFLLPSWIPLLTRFICTKSISYSVVNSLSAMHGYKPYKENCFIHNYNQTENNHGENT
jgi:hypothetical protein